MGIFLTGLTYHSSFGFLECLVMSLTLTLELKFYQRNFSNKVVGITNSVKRFQNSRRHYDLVSKFNTGLRSLLKQVLSEFEFYGDFLYKFKKIVGRNDFSDQFRKIMFRY